MTGAAGGDPGEPGTRRRRLAHVYWIGGGSGAGKTTIAAELAARHRLRVYSADEAMAEHDRRSALGGAPLLARFKAMDMDERWVSRCPEVMLETFHWFRGELFGLIVGDLLALPAQPGVIAEGFRLLPPLVAPLLADPRQAVWLLPAPEFRRAAFTSRGTVADIPGRTSDPGAALRNLLARDDLFTRRLREQTAQLGLAAIDVPAGMTRDDLTRQVESALGLDRQSRRCGPARSAT